MREIILITVVAFAGIAVSHTMRAAHDMTQFRATEQASAQYGIYTYDE
jgi:hypothetical protein